MTTTAGPRTNWAGNITFGAPDFSSPASLGELRAVVGRARQVRVLGTGHSFNDMADSPGVQVSLAGLPPEVEVDSAASLVRVTAGLSYAGLAVNFEYKSSSSAFEVVINNSNTNLLLEGLRLLDEANRDQGEGEPALSEDLWVASNYSSMPT